MELYEEIHDITTGETTRRPFTKEEVAEYKRQQAESDAIVKEAEAAAAKKAAILDALATATGYTADELREALNA